MENHAFTEVIFNILNEFFPDNSQSIYKNSELLQYLNIKTRSANNRSHAMNKTKRTSKPNLQKVTVLIDGKPKKVWASARALKSGKVERV